eukprot:scaffold17761_cov59-Cylindrotheca_fusiformis.AAC.1
MPISEIVPNYYLLPPQATSHVHFSSSFMGERVERYLNNQGSRFPAQRQPIARQMRPEENRSFLSGSVVIENNDNTSSDQTWHICGNS